ncbi:hypothetical protein VIBNISO65_990017 [Vibrio nigripulchritudo SO65]|nr:hypothetical protein VIBNIAM115_880016 [Vibrio nigripulchritudo AM115]CCN44657.1 hypothetical protein VIBNIFTn2_870021 [Vibrio nigripulchritudo FTn2]CCN62939.1 hypothetical protein VIBNIPon4_1050021 [Vibrio nigripulchritudo POn4]CCN79646.1 hypothetical protein VIBNISO65_990017 [Vibrio nigripulchritudo SO65]
MKISLSSRFPTHFEIPDRDGKGASELVFSLSNATPNDLVDDVAGGWIEHKKAASVTRLLLY